MTRFLWVFQPFRIKNVKIQTMKNIKKYLFPLAALTLVGLLIFSLSNRAVAPDVTFVTLEGTKIRMTDLKGKVVLVNFWATDCPGCIQEMPDLVKTYNAYKQKGFEVIAVAMPYDPPAQVVNYQKEKALPFPVMHDGYGEITNQFGGVNLTPTAFIFDKEGKRVQRTIGKLDFNQLRAMLDEELG